MFTAIYTVDKTTNVVWGNYAIFGIAINAQALHHYPSSNRRLSRDGHLTIKVAVSPERRTIDSDSKVLDNYMK